MRRIDICGFAVSALRKFLRGDYVNTKGRGGGRNSEGFLAGPKWDEMIKSPMAAPNRRGGTPADRRLSPPADVLENGQKRTGDLASRGRAWRCRCFRN